MMPLAPPSTREEIARFFVAESSRGGERMFKELVSSPVDGFTGPFCPLDEEVASLRVSNMVAGSALVALARIAAAAFASTFA